MSNPRTMHYFPSAVNSPFTPTGARRDARWERPVQGSATEASIGAVGDRPKDCELWCDVADFMSIIDGTLDAREAFMSGRLRIVGDVGLALRLQDVISSAA